MVLITGETVAPKHTGGGNTTNKTDIDCSDPIVYYAKHAKVSGRPIALIDGEKTEQISDLVVQSPGAPLVFRRSYRQSMQGELDHMGLGWTHNHRMRLNEDPSGDPIIVHTASGGEAYFSLDTGNTYKGDPGSNAVIDAGGSGDSKYTLTTEDKRVFVFDSAGKLRQRTLASGETWTYSYYQSPHVAAGELKEVADDYGRKLQFSYVDDVGEFDHLQLWRVGDQDASGLEGGSPSGRYVEFGYTTEKDDGTVVNDPKALLASVQDVRGQTWTYDYYGQASGEDETALLNYLTEHGSPSVDSNGSGSPDGSITLKKLTYGLSRDLAVNGDMEEDDAWDAISGSEPDSDGQSSAQSYGGSTYSWHVDASAAGQGIEGNAWKLVEGRTYTITAQVYGVSGTVKMQVSNESAFDTLSKPALNGDWQELSVSHTATSSTPNRELQFIASGGAAEFYVDSVTIVETYPSGEMATIRQELGKQGSDPYLMQLDYLFQPGGETATHETVDEKTTIHHFNGEVYMGAEDPAGNAPEELLSSDYRPLLQTDPNGNETYLEWGSNGKTLDKVTDALGNSTQLGYDGEDNDERLVSNLDALARQTVYAYDGARRQPTLIVSGAKRQEAAIDGDMDETDSWDDVGTPAENYRDDEEAYQGSYSRYVEADLDEGIESAAIDFQVNRSYTITAHVFLWTAVPVKMQVDNLAAFDVVSSDETYAWQTLRAVHTVTSAEAGSKKLQFIAQGDGAEFNVDAVSVVASDEIVLNGDMEASGGWSGISSPDLNERVPAPDSGLYTHHVETDAANEGIESNEFSLEDSYEYTVSARVFPVSGTVKMQIPGVTFDGGAVDTTSGSGGWETLQGTFTHSGSTVDKTLQFLAVTGDPTDFYLDTVSIRKSGTELAADGGMEEDWQPVGTPATNEQSSTQVDSGDYSRHVVADQDEGVESNRFDLIAGLSYTISARVYRVSGTIRMQLSDDANFDDEASTSGWQTLSVTHIPEETALDQRVQFLASGGSAEFYLDSVSVTCAGAELAVDGGMEAAWNAISGAAPSVNEQTVAALTGDYARRVDADENDGVRSASWDLKPGYSYLFMARVFPVSGTVKAQVPGISGWEDSSDQEGVWQTLRGLYSHSGASVSKTLDVLAEGGSAQFYLDSVHLLAVDDPLSWQEFLYDRRGRTLAQSEISVEDASLIRQTLHRYYSDGDGAGLLQATIQRDLDGSGDVTTSYLYDSAGRVVQVNKNTTFGSCRRSYTVYDAAGNVLASICNYNNSGAAPTTAAEAAALYDANYPDDNQVTTHDYDQMGRRIKTTTMAGSDFEQTAWTLYDALNRPIRTIANYEAQGSSAPGDWEWANDQWEDGSSNAIQHGDDHNQNIISDSAYNARGLVESRTDVLGRVTRYLYDDAGRLARTIVNYVTQGSTDPADWVFESGVWKVASGGAAVDHGDADQNIISEQLYDANGNPIDSADPVQTKSYTVYDALNRPIRTIANYVAQGATDPADWVWEDDQWKVASGGAAVDQGSGYQQNIITETAYDTVGRVIGSFNPVQIETRTVYDPLDRPVRTIANYLAQGTADPADWVFEGGQWKVASGGANVDHGSAQDQNIVTETVYDDAGRVRYTRAVNGIKTWTVYDGLGRVKRTIANCSYAGTGTAPEDSAYQGDLGDPAADLISEQFYDDDGRVVKTRRVLKANDAQTDLEWVWTLNGYDALGRLVKTVQNASTPGYDVASDPDLSGYTPGSNTDEDIVSETVYDDLGRVQKTIDTNGSVTLNGYDTSGRQVKVIRSASTPGYDIAGDPDLSGYSASSAGDEDIVSETVYDVAGRVRKTIDTEGNVTLNGYDLLGRRVKVIGNASNPNGSFADDLSDYTGSSPDADQDRVVTTTFDLSGRILKVTNAQGNVTLYGYDTAGRRVKTIQNASNATGSFALDLSDYTGDDPDEDQDRTSSTAYDQLGRAYQTVDAAGKETRSIFDDLGRRVRTITNYAVQGTSDPADWEWVTDHWEDGDSNGIDHDSDSGNGKLDDQNLIGDTVYNAAGQVVSTRDGRGTVTGFSYDGLGRRLTVTQDQGGALQTVAYHCYDKGGRLRRTIQNWIDDGTSPDDRTNGEWDFAPGLHGALNDENLITEYGYDQAGRQTQVTDPAGNLTGTTYFRDGQVDSVTDPEEMVTVYRYDQLRRRCLVVQNYVTNGEDPEDWVWSGSQYEESDTTPIVHGSDDDQNLIVQSEYDKRGNRLQQRDPLGRLTAMAYDRLGRVVAQVANYLPQGASDIADWEWDTDHWEDGANNNISHGTNGDENAFITRTAYEDVAGGTTRTTVTRPDGSPVERDFDRLGRPTGIDYNDDANTAKVAFSYDSDGNRSEMTEHDGTDYIRKTGYDYDAARRLSQVDFDTDGDDTVDETVNYEYDRGGRRTTMILPGSLAIAYEYDAKGQLIGLTDWDDRETKYAYDNAGRQVAAFRDNGLRSRYQYDPASRLTRLFHAEEGRALADFRYTLDGRGNRVRALELLAHPATASDTVYAYDDAGIVWTGSWSDDSPYKKTEAFDASMKLLFYGENRLKTTKVTFTFGTGVNHSLFDVYIGGSLWQTFDGYEDTAGERTVNIPLMAEGLHLFEIRNRPQHSLDARNDAGYDADTFICQFKQLKVEDTEYDLHTVEYSYDALSRLQEARYNPGLNLDAADGDLLRRYQFDYDLAGNRKQRTVHIDGSQDSDVSYSYNGVNQLTAAGATSYTYDSHGNLSGDGSLSYTWDRANRLLGVGDHSYLYDGDGARVQKTVSSVVTDYLLDVQPDLVKVLAATSGANTERYLHGPRGIQAMEDPSSEWLWMVQDGLGSVRMELDDTSSVEAMGSYAPYGDPFGVQDVFAGPFRYTGEQTDGNGQVYLRKRYYTPGMGVFVSRDPVETANRYAYVDANPVNKVDPSGLIGQLPAQFPVCSAKTSTGTISWSPGITSPKHGGFKGGPLLKLPPSQGPSKSKLPNNRPLSKSPSQQQSPLDYCRRSCEGTVGLGLPHDAPYFGSHAYEEDFAICVGDCIKAITEFRETVRQDRCHQWLDNAYDVLQSGGTWSQQAASILEEYYSPLTGTWDCSTDSFSPANIITFNNPSVGSMTPYGRRILMNPDSLQTQISCPGQWGGFCGNFREWVGVLSQELWHTQQGGDRLSVWGELDAHNLEIRVRQEIDLPPMLEPAKETLIMNLGDPGSTTRDVSRLCEAREALPDFWLYNNEPLVYLDPSFDLAYIITGGGIVPQELCALYQ